MMRLVLLLSLLVILVTGCSGYRRKQIVRVSAPEPMPAPIATRMSPALDCLSEALVHDPPRLNLDVWVCPFAASSGLSPEAGWQYTMDALLRVSYPGGPINIRDCRTEWTPTPTDPRAAFISGMSISGRAVLENGVIADYADFGAGLTTSGANLLGFGTSTELSRMAVSMYLRAEDRSLLQQPVTAAAIFESSSELNVDVTVAIVEGAGISAGAGMLEVSSKEQILRHLVDAGVFSMVVQYFEAGSECIDAANNWHRYRDELLALGPEDQKRVKDRLRRRLGGAGKVPRTLPSYDGTLTLDEYAWARAARFLDDTGDDSATVVASAAEPAAPATSVAGDAAPRRDETHAVTTEAPSSPKSAAASHSGGLFLANGRLISAADGYAECFAADREGSRVQRLGIAGANYDGRIVKARPYEVRPPANRLLDRVMCFRTPASLYEFLPVGVREGQPVVMLFADIRAIFERRGWQLASVSTRIS